MKELIKALEIIKREAGSHTVSISHLRPAHGFGFIYDVANDALDKYTSQQADDGNTCIKCGCIVPAFHNLCETCMSITAQVI